MSSTAVIADRLPDPGWTFGDRLRKARIRYGATQRDFADALAVKHATYAAWEADRTTCPRESAVAKRIEVLTGTRAAWLLDVDGLPPAPLPPHDAPSPSVGAEATTLRFSPNTEAAVIEVPSWRRAA